MINGAPYANINIDKRSADVISSGTTVTTRAEVEHAVGTKRRSNEQSTQHASGTATASKRPKRSDQNRVSSSSKMDSIAGVVGISIGKKLGEPNSSIIDEERDSERGSVPSESVVSQIVDLPSLPDNFGSLRPLTNGERKELEGFLEFNKEERWRQDWMGNLCFVDKEINAPDSKSRERGKKALFYWAAKGKTSLKLLNNLVRYVYNLPDAPHQAKKILANADTSSAKSVQEAVRRVSYDPDVLNHDGWTTVKSEEPIGASGGPFRIGEKVIWQGSEGIVIAYVHDPDIGDLWKAMMIEELDTFDLEVEELEDGRKRFERKMVLLKKQQSSNAKQEPTGNVERRTGRNNATEFTVEGIEHGIVLAVSYGKGARPGVMWPARVRHFSELEQQGSQKRLVMRQKVEVIFLAPYWNNQGNEGRGRSESYADSLQRHGSSIFTSGPLLEIECIDATPDSIAEYPFEAHRGGLGIEELSTSFRFSGLPKAAFSRFIQSHRLALALKTYSQTVLLSTAATEIDKTTAYLFEAHAMAGLTANFPPEVLQLPFSYILSQLPIVEYDAVDASCEEPVLQLGVILESMKPPSSWGQGHSATVNAENATPESATPRKPPASPFSITMKAESSMDGASSSFDDFLSGLKSLSDVLSSESEPMSALLALNLRMLLNNIPHLSDELTALSIDAKQERLKGLAKLWIVVKTNGEELIASYKKRTAEACLSDWRQVCERIYKFMTVALSDDGFGNGISWILSDSLCNLHLTSTECFERAVRLPAAMRAAKEVASTNSRLRIMNSVRDKYLEMAEKEVIRRAHTKVYLKRMKKKCQSVATEGEIVALTADSDNHGGEDTKGTKGSWTAAIAAVAASVQGVDMIMNGECVNVLCLTRPPGHHAGRELHAMKAVSNGFCLLNNAACAALYATAPVSEGGAGLRRVCVIDIDVHHGNGTQDILCSTYDPRFLYVSLHAGGPDINGVDVSGEEAEQFSHHLAGTPKKGIFPGRCGDSSPHPGVLNIPLGARVTSHAVGTALINRVTPSVEKFSPELIIVSAGFDAHKNDPLNLGGLSAEDFGTLTEVICKLAHKSCSGRVLSILEGGYGVPCCRLPENIFDPEESKKRLEKLSEQSRGRQTPTSNESIKEEVMLNSVSSTVEGDETTPSTTSDPMGKEPGPSNTTTIPAEESQSPVLPVVTKSEPPLKPLQILDLGDDLPENMKDDMSYALMKRLDRCHAEGFVDCVKEHIVAMTKCNLRK